LHHIGTATRGILYLGKPMLKSETTWRAWWEMRRGRISPRGERKKNSKRKGKETEAKKWVEEKGRRAVRRKGGEKRRGRGEEGRGSKGGLQGRGKGGGEC